MESGRGIVSWRTQPWNGLNLSWLIWVQVPGWNQDLGSGRGIVLWKIQLWEWVKPQLDDLGTNPRLDPGFGAWQRDCSMQDTALQQDPAPSQVGWGVITCFGVIFQQNGPSEPNSLLSPPQIFPKHFFFSHLLFPFLQSRFAAGIGSRFPLLKESRGQGVRTLRNAFDVVLKAELLSELFYVKGKKKNSR